MTPSSHLPVTEVLGQEFEADLDQICRLCGLETQELLAWIREGIAEPHGQEPAQWRFSTRQVRRVRVARRLQRDLELDPQVLPMVLDLLEELEQLRHRVRVLERVLED